MREYNNHYNFKQFCGLPVLQFLPFLALGYGILINEVIDNKDENQNGNENKKSEQPPGYQSYNNNTKTGENEPQNAYGCHSKQ